MAKDDPKARILERAEREKVKFMRLQFTDILGVIKNVEVPDRQFEEALDGRIMFDGSSIEGFVRIEESDMYLKPDLRTFQVFPWSYAGSERVARIICDIANPDGTPFTGCPRSMLKRAIAVAAEKGFTMQAGPEAEFFLFQRRATGEPTTETHDSGGYFDLTPVDLGEDVRREIILALEQMGFHVEAAHHEVAPGQHEIDFRHDDALITADNVSTFRFVVKNVANRNGLHATFMPKPVFGENGSGMHTHQSLFREGRNAFYDADDQYFLSETGKAFIAGQLKHAREICSLFAQWVNSYKRLVPGYEAPVYVAWSRRNRSALVRVPLYHPGKEQATRMELRCPDPACNPYLTFAALLQAGLEGIEKGYELPEPMEKNLYHLSPDDRKRLGIEQLPETLGEAIEITSESELVLRTLGEHMFNRYVEIKRQEWEDYRVQVTPWELQRYLPVI
jgi:glutamine synthetase